MGEPLLRIEGLTKRFGGLIACDAVSLEIAPGEVHAVIGPTGAGKTTLVAQLGGALRPDEGRVIFEGRDITRAAPEDRSRLGIARSFQITSVFAGFSALDNVALAVQAHAGHSFRFWRPVAGDAALEDPARAALERIGLGDRAGDRAGDLSHGARRQLELAMARVTEPRLLLLDEPTAGMGREDSDRMIALLDSLKGERAMMLVEHDMDAVFALADRITVMTYGKVIATDSPAAIRANEAVRAAYLGTDEVT
jgi:branched-chain amino acid transport system ATP-binding protein